MPARTLATNILSGLKTKRFLCSPVALIAYVVGYTLIAFNATYWSKGLDIFEAHIGQLIILTTVVFLLTMAIFALFNLPYLLKPFLAFTLILGAITSYYTDTLGVVINRDMVQNAATTTLIESKHLLTPGLSLHVLVFGLLPAVFLLIFVRLKPQRRWVAVTFPVLIPALCVAVSLGLLLTNYKTYASVLRERHDYMSSYQPVAPMVAALKYVKMMTSSFDIAVSPLGNDAQKGPVYDLGHKPTLTIIVAGETARAQNFSLNGYSVPTNPELAKKNIVNFSNVTSCGTATATSLPCMFSNYTRKEYSFKKGISTENLLDVLTHAGFKVEWWDNNTGDKAVANRVPVTSFTRSQDPKFCGEGECVDGIFLKQLQAYLPTITQDTVLVLHQIGSHGPAYYLRYPEAFEKFKPACRTADFLNCTPQEVTNAYDNTIAYTDFVLSQTIDLLEQQQGLLASLVYVSDHGESLGENGLYLHGAPYFMAPEEQTKVPMILWMSDAFKKQMALSDHCLFAKADADLSHDNLFHSILGMLHVQTSAYQRALDIFADCAAPHLTAKNDR